MLLPLDNEQILSYINNKTNNHLIDQQNSSQARCIFCCAEPVFRCIFCDSRKIFVVFFVTTTFFSTKSQRIIALLRTFYEGINAKPRGLKSLGFVL